MGGHVILYLTPIYFTTESLNNQQKFTQGSCAGQSAVRLNKLTPYIRNRGSNCSGGTSITDIHKKFSTCTYPQSLRRCALNFSILLILLKMVYIQKKRLRSKTRDGFSSQTVVILKKLWYN